MTENELTHLLINSVEFGITGVRIDYDGCGDSGQIEYIGYTKEEDVICEDLNLLIEAWDKDHNLSLLNTSLHADFEAYGYSLLDNVEDWYNNDGGYGTILILIPSGKYIIYNNIRIQNIESFTHEGVLKDKITTD